MVLGGAATVAVAIGHCPEAEESGFMSVRFGPAYQAERGPAPAEAPLLAPGDDRPLPPLLDERVDSLDRRLGGSLLSQLLAAPLDGDY